MGYQVKFGEKAQQKKWELSLTKGLFRSKVTITQYDFLRQAVSAMFPDIRRKVVTDFHGIII